MAWNKNENIIDSSKWLGEKINLIEKKDADSSKLMNMIINRGGVYDVEFGKNIGGEKNKKRPSLVISINILNKGHTVVVVPLSTKYKKQSNGKPKYKNDFVLFKSKYNLLREDSVIKIADIKSVDKARIHNKLFDVTKEDMERIGKKIKFLFGIN